MIQEYKLVIKSKVNEKGIEEYYFNIENNLGGIEFVSDEYVSLYLATQAAHKLAEIINYSDQARVIEM